MPARTVLIELLAETRQMRKALEKTDKQVEGITTRVRGLSTAFKAAFGVTIGTFAIRGVRKFIKSIGRAVDESFKVIRAAEGANIAVETYQRLGFAMDHIGLSAKSAANAINNLQSRLAKGAKIDKAFRKAGFDPDRLRALGPMAAFNEALSAAKSSGNTAQVLELFFGGASGKEMARVIRQWKEYNEVLGVFDRRVGTALKGGAIPAIKQFKLETDVTARAFENAKITIAQEALPEITSALKALNETGFLPGVGNVIAGLIKRVDDFHDAIKLLLIDLGRLTPGALPRRPTQGTGPGGKVIKAPVSPAVSPLGIFGKTLDFDKRFRMEVRTQQKTTPGLLEAPPTVHMNFFGVRERDTAHKAARAVEAATRRGTQGLE